MESVLAEDRRPRERGRIPAVVAAAVDRDGLQGETSELGEMTGVRAAGDLGATTSWTSGSPKRSLTTLICLT